MTFITSASVNHHTASVGHIEAARFGDVDAALKRLAVTGASEAMVLQTLQQGRALRRG